MKRKGGFWCVLFLSVFAAKGLFAVELWEGIDTNMTKDQALAKAREVFQVTRPAVEQSGKTEIETVFDFEFLRENRKDLPNNLYPQNFTSLWLLSPLERYERDYYLNMSNFTPDRNRPIPNIHLHFDKEKLFGMIIKWGIPYRSLLETAERKYGKPTETFTQVMLGSRYTWNVFETPEIIVYCAEVQGKYSHMCIISKEIF